MEVSFKDWLELFKKLHGQLPHTEGLECPNCGALEIQYQYVGNVPSRIGYLAMWCGSCLTGIQLSRVEAPECVEILSFDADPESFKRIPRFRQVVPTE